MKMDEKQVINLKTIVLQSIMNNCHFWTILFYSIREILGSEMEWNSAIIFLFVENIFLSLTQFLWLSIT